MKIKPIIIAVTGKGGSGKSVISALMAKVLSEEYNFKLLLIDADPTHAHLSDLVNVHSAKSLEKIRNDLINAPKSQKEEIDFLVQDIDFMVYESMAETKRFCLLSIGQPQQKGCFCPANTLLKKAISTVSKDFDIVIIDCEAGLEQINRNVIQGIDLLLIISDLSIRSLETANSIKKLGKKFTNYKISGLILNKIEEDLQPKFLEKINSLDMNLFAQIPNDSEIRNLDIKGIPLINIPKESKSYLVIKKLVKKLIYSFENEMSMSN